VERDVSSLNVTASMPLELRLDLLAKWLAGLHARDTFNGTVLIAKDGKVLFERHLGFADLARTVPLSGQSSFALASVSKQFTAMGVMLLAHRGRLGLDDKVPQHIPELADFRGVSIRQLLHHTSGAPDYLELADKFWPAGRVLATADVVALLARHRPPLYFAPGSRFEYSNTGYLLLAEVVARASATPFAEFMAAEIFAPLGMADSAAFNFASARCPLRARVFGVRRDLERRVDCDLNHLDGVFGDAGIYASAADLVRWDEALRNGGLLPGEIYAEAFRSGELNNGQKTGYGFGWEIDPPDVVWHWGELQGFTAYMRRDLKRRTLLVLLSNVGPPAWLEPLSAELTEFMYEI
jgi:CubicO group peptidase (beta-lactamase class C family)